MDITIRRTLASVEWEMVIEEWGKRCSTDRGRNLLRRENLFRGWKEADQHMRMVEEIRALSRDGNGLYVEDIPELDEIVSTLEKGGYLKAKDLARVIALQKNVRAVLKRITKQETPNLFFYFGALDGLGYLTSLLEGAIDEEGNVRSDASPKLFGLRKRVQELRKEIVSKLEKMMQNPAVSPYLQDDFYTVREERYVLPVKSEFRAQVPGMIHGASASGQTVYIEPHALVDLNNRIRELRLDIELEELKVLSDLGDAVSDELPQIKRNIELMARLDIWIGAARLADDLGLEPWTFGEELRLRKARHPILVAMGMNVVPNDITLDQGKILMVTGPNAGGKTVLLKTIGLSVLMASAGLPVPAKDGEIPEYRQVFAIIGDPQDITEHKSTFSGHVEWLKDVISRVDRQDLVLIDELASGTDPSQGAALAQAILEFLGDRGATVVATTHYAVLKALALTDSRFSNASIGGTGLKPDYKLVIGVPGVSSGLDLARRLGLPEEIVRRGEEIFRDGDRGLDELFVRLREREQKLQNMEAELREKLDQARAKTEELERLKRELERQRVEIIKEKRDEVMEELDRLRNMVVVLEERAKKKGKKAPRPEHIRESMDKIREKVRDLDRSMTSEPDLKIGARLYSLSLGREVEVVELMGNRVKVRSGALYVELARDDLRSIDTLRKNAGEKRVERKKRSSGGKRSAPERSSEVVHVMKPSSTLDLRGVRVDDALDRLEKFMDRMMMEGESSFAVIHGFGSGALMKAVRKFLNDSPYISKFRPGEKGEGGEGVTIAFLV